MIAVLRIGHRPDRDKRITTHVALVARAFGAEKMFVDTKDRKLEETIRSVCGRFGGDFTIETGVSAKTILTQWEGLVVHLTMYGEKLAGITLHTITKIESGATPDPRIETMAKIAKGLGISIDDLMKK